MALDKFIQPADGIEIAWRLPGGRLVLSDAEVEAAASRVYAGENEDEVAEELALQHVFLTQEDEDNSPEPRALGWFESDHPRHEAGTPEGGQFAPKNDGGSLHRAVMDALEQKPLKESERLGGMHQPLELGAADIQDVKAAAAVGVAKRMADKHPDWTPHVCASIIDEWAETSGDHQPGACAQQHVANDHLGLGAPTDHLGKPDKVAMADPGSAAYVDAEYEFTQQFLKSHGVTEATVFRGIHASRNKLSSLVPDEDGDLEIAMQPLSSWATTPRDAAHFTGLNDGMTVGAVLVATVPASRIQSTSVTGRGCIEESEVILRGGQLKVRVMRRGDLESKESFAKRVGEYVDLLDGRPL